MTGFDWPGQAGNTCLPVWLKSNYGEWTFADREAGLVFFVLDRPPSANTFVTAYAIPSKSNNKPKSLGFFQFDKKSIKSECSWFAVAVDVNWNEFTLRLEIYELGKKPRSVECSFKDGKPQKSEIVADNECYIQDTSNFKSPNFFFPDLVRRKPPSPSCLARLRVQQQENNVFGPAEFLSSSSRNVEILSQPVEGMDSYLRIFVNRDEDPYIIERNENSTRSAHQTFSSDRMFYVSSMALQKQTRPSRFTPKLDLHHKAVGIIPAITLGRKAEYRLEAPDVGDFVFYLPTVGEPEVDLQSILAGGAQGSITTRDNRGWVNSKLHAYVIGKNYQLVPISTNLDIGAEFGAIGEQVDIFGGGDKKDEHAKNLEVAIERYFIRLAGDGSPWEFSNPSMTIGKLYDMLSTSQLMEKAVSETAMLTVQLLIGQLVNRAFASVDHDEEKKVDAADVVMRNLDLTSSGFTEQICSPMLQIMTSGNNSLASLSGLENRLGLTHMGSNLPGNATPDFADTLESVLLKATSWEPDVIETWVHRASPGQQGQILVVIAGDQIPLAEWMVKNEAALSFGCNTSLSDIVDNEEAIQLAKSVTSNGLIHEITTRQFEGDSDCLAALEKLKPEGENHHATELLAIDAALIMWGKQSFSKTVKAAGHLTNIYSVQQIRSALDGLKTRQDNLLAKSKTWSKSNNNLPISLTGNHVPEIPLMLAYMLQQNILPEGDLSPPETSPPSLSSEQYPEVAKDLPEEEADFEADGPETSGAGERGTRNSNTRIADNIRNEANLNFDKAHASINNFNQDIQRALQSANQVANSSQNENRPDKDREAARLYEMMSELNSMAKDRLKNFQNTYDEAYEQRPERAGSGGLSQDQMEDLYSDVARFEAQHMSELRRVKNLLLSTLMERIDQINEALNAADGFVEKWQGCLSALNLVNEPNE